MGVEEELEVFLKSALAALQAPPDGVGLVFLGLVPGAGWDNAVKDDAVDVAGEGGGLEIANGGGAMVLFFVSIKHLGGGYGRGWSGKEDSGFRL